MLKYSNTRNWAWKRVSTRFAECNVTLILAVWKVDVHDFPAFIVVNDKGEDFFSKWLG